MLQPANYIKICNEYISHNTKLDVVYDIDIYIYMDNIECQDKMYFTLCLYIYTYKHAYIYIYMYICAHFEYNEYKIP